MTLTPPAPASAGQPYWLYYEFFDFETGVLTDPAVLTLDITYGEEVGFVPDIAGPFTFTTGTASPAVNTIWRTGTGLYTFWWQVPASGLLPGVYVANWTAGYGIDSFLSMENFPIVSGAPFLPVPSGDAGYWSGSLTYAPPWSPSPFAINFGETDASGVTWLWQSIAGWDSPPTVGSVIQRSADHGGWPAVQVYGPRIITLTVAASAPTQALRDAARAELQQAVALGSSGTDLSTLVFNEPVPKQALVRRNGSASVTEASPTLTDVIFTIPLVAPDPRKYSTMQQTSQIVLPAPPQFPLALPFVSGLPEVFPAGIPPETITLSVTNAGTFETRPQLVLTGPVAGPSIVNGNTGQAVSFDNLSMASTDTLTIDMDNRQPFLNGAFYAADPDSAWWVLEPGTTPVYVSGVSPGGSTLTITWSSAWI